MTAAAPAFTVVAYGVDDLTLGFDMTGSRSLGRLNEMPGVSTRRGKMLGQAASWGAWSHVLGRSAAFWKSDTSRLYVQAKLAPAGELCGPAEVGRGVKELMERMAIVGVVSFEEPWITRIDVAVDAECAPADGKLLLDALEAVRLSNGWRTTSVGNPRSTVYFRARQTEKVYARAYCRNLKTKQGAPFGLIRLEAEARFDPKQVLLAAVSSPEFVPFIWTSRYGGLASTVTRLAREAQAIELGRRIGAGELRYAEAERLHLFLELERLGIAASSYPKATLATRRRDAVRLGFAAGDVGQASIDVELAALLEPYARAVREAVAA